MSIPLSSIISSGSSKLNFEEFTSSGTWTRPNSNIKVVSFVLVGGGGSGARASASTFGGGGGGGSEIVYGSIPTTSNLSITIGAGATAPTNTTSNGSKGDNSQITGGLFDVIAYGGQGGSVFYGANVGTGGAGGTIGATYVKSTYAGGWQFGSESAAGRAGNSTDIGYGLTGFSTNNGLIIRVGGSGGGQGSYPGTMNASDGGTSPFAKGGTIRTTVGGGAGGASFEAGGRGADGSATAGDDGTKGSGGGGGTVATYAGDGGDGYCIIFWYE